MNWTKLTRIEVSFERSLASRVEQQLQAQGIERWIILPAISGRSGQGRWERAGQIVEAGRDVMLVVTLPPEKAEKLVEVLSDLLDPYQADIVTSAAQRLERDD